MPAYAVSLKVVSSEIVGNFQKFLVFC